MSSKIHPHLTYLKRFSCRPRLWGLTSFSKKLSGKLRNEKSVTLPQEGEGKVHRLADVLRSKNIRKIHLSGEFRAFFTNEKILLSRLAQAIRIAIRELATHGIPKTEKACSILDRNSADKIKLEIKVKIKPGNGTCAEVHFETISTLEISKQSLKGYRSKIHW